MNKKKIVVTGTRGIPHIMGGVETHCEELFPRLVGMGYDVTIIRRTPYVDKDNDVALGVSQQQWKGVHLIDINAPKRKAIEAIVHTTKAVFTAKRRGADILHVHAIGPALAIPLAKLLGLKVVFTHHGPDYDRDKWGFMAKKMLRIGEWCACKYADHVIVISDVIKELIANKHGRMKNVHLIFNGVPSPELCHEPEYFKSLGIEEGKYILGMCRFVPEKHLHDLILAYKKLKCEKRIPEDERLVLAGDTDFEDNYSRDLKKLAKLNDVVLTGFIHGSKLHSLLANAMCYSLPSSHEGLPIALLEAMSYQLPVLTTNIPANLAVNLDPDCYHNVGDVDTMAKKLEAICNKPLQRIKYDMGKYDWDIIAQQVAEVYEML